MPMMLYVSAQQLHVAQVFLMPLMQTAKDVAQAFLMLLLGIQRVVML